METATLQTAAAAGEPGHRNHYREHSAKELVKIDAWSISPVWVSPEKESGTTFPL